MTDAAHPSERIHLIEHDATWPKRFEDEVALLRKHLGSAAGPLRFEHVGSTAVAGLISKPIIDVLIIPPPGEWPKDVLCNSLSTAGYVFWSDNPDQQHLFFVKGMPPFGTGRTHHVHVRPLERALPVLAFRDHLRIAPQHCRRIRSSETTTGSNARRRS